MFQKHKFLLCNIFCGGALCTIFTVTIYILNIPSYVNISIWGPRLIAPVAVGAFLGLLLGLMYHLKERKEKSLTTALELQKILNGVSILAHQNETLDDIIDKSIDFIVSAPFSKSKAKVGIFLTTTPNRLELKSHLNLPKSILNKCGRGIDFGDCLCGQAAKEKKSIFKKHHVNYHGNNSSICQDITHSDHGHYIIPIIQENNSLGVIVVYLDVNHPYNKVEIEFLESLANVLGLIIKKQEMDIKVIDSELDLRETHKLAGLGSWVYNRSNETFLVCSELIHILGFDNENIDITQNLVLNNVYPSDKGKMEEAFKNAKNGEPFEIELRYVKKNKEIAYVINKCQPKLLANGYVHEIKGTMFDITSLRVNELELVKNRHLIQGILNATPDPLFLLDLNTAELLYSNEAMKIAQNKYLFFAEKLNKVGVSIFKTYVHPEDIGEYEMMESSLRDGDDFYKVVFRTKVLNDKYIWIEERVLVYDRDVTGHINQVLIVVKDLDEKIKTEKKITNLNKGLTHQNTEIKKINNELDHFVYSVSHDLRSPLSSILGLVNLSRYNSENAQLKEYIEKIGLSVTKMDSFIKDVLSYSKNKKTEVEKEAINLEALFVDVLNDIRILNSSDVKLRLSKDINYKFIGDKLRIKNILSNVLTNACKYADFNKTERYIKVNISTSIDGCTFLVEDNGIGIKEQYLERIFDMFFRATEKSKGSGLGLFIVKELVSKLDGSIKIESEEGVGTKVIVKLPTFSNSDQKEKIIKIGEYSPLD